MNTTPQQPAVINHEAIARLACRIWQQEGGQSGRDQEYWFQAEQQLRAISQLGDSAGVNAACPQKKSPAKVKGQVSL
jgi:hypothetical protein